MGREKNEVGNKFGRLKVKELVGYSKGRKAIFLCECECGTEKPVAGSDLRSGHTKSCGCLNIDKIKERSVSHGKSSHPLFTVWLGMRQRCYYLQHKDFSTYGGKGIKVCEEWDNDFGEFFRWALISGWVKGLQIDREDSDLGYTPDNCRWVTPLQNRHNCGTRKDNKTGFTGVGPHRGRFVSRIGFSNKGRACEKHLGLFKTALEAVIARDKFIIENKLKYHKLQVLKREEENEEAVD